MTENTTPESTPIKPRLTVEERESLYLDYVNDLDVSVEGLLEVYGISRRTLERLLRDKGIPAGTSRELAVFVHMSNTTGITRPQMVEAIEVALNQQSPQDQAMSYMLNLTIPQLGELWANVVEIQNKAVLSQYLNKINEDILSINSKIVKTIDSDV